MCDPGQPWEVLVNGFWTLVSWISKCSLVNLVFAQFEALEWNSFHILRHWSLKFLEICDLRAKVRSWKLKKAEMGVWRTARRAWTWRGSSGPHIPVPHFSVCSPQCVCLKPYWLSVKISFGFIFLWFLFLGPKKWTPLDLSPPPPPYLWMFGCGSESSSNRHDGSNSK